MPKRSDFKLTESELYLVAEAIRADMSPEVQKRAAAIQLLANGHKPAEVAQRFGVRPLTIRNWFRRFRREGYAGLSNHPNGQPRVKADQFYFQELEAAIQRKPGDYGYAYPNWTTERLRDHLETSTGVRISVSRLGMLIRKQGHLHRGARPDPISLQDSQENI
jgi:putative transposase